MKIAKKSSSIKNENRNFPHIKLIYCTYLMYITTIFFFIYLYPSSHSVQKEKEKKKYFFKHATFGKNHYKVLMYFTCSFVMNENKFSYNSFSNIFFLM